MAPHSRQCVNRSTLAARSSVRGPTSSSNYTSGHSSARWLFDQFFYQAIKGHILAHDRIDPQEAAWQRQMIFWDSEIDYQERMFLH